MYIYIVCIGTRAPHKQRSQETMHETYQSTGLLLPVCFPIFFSVGTHRLWTTSRLPVQRVVLADMRPLLYRNLTISRKQQVTTFGRAIREQEQDGLTALNCRHDIMWHGIGTEALSASQPSPEANNDKRRLHFWPWRLF